MSDPTINGSMIVNLEEMAELMSVSLPTLRILMRENEDFPVLERGTNGTAYQFDAFEVSEFMADRATAAGAASAERAAELKASRLDLFPALDDDAESLGKSSAQLKTEGEATRIWDDIALRRGQLCRVDDVDNALRSAFAAFRAQFAGLADRLARKFDLAREARIGLRDEFDAALAGVAQAMRDQDEGKNERAA